MLCFFKTLMKKEETSMELTVYRQSSKTRPDGTIVYKGEDARPYVDEH